MLEICLQSLHITVSVAKPVFWDIAATKSINMLLIAAITDFVMGGSSSLGRLKQLCKFNIPTCSRGPHFGSVPIGQIFG
ncbi:hypothetical protein [Xenorhabdus budapestensis]|uniref:Uncharacterized protein n=1 Tax=Xenorhabdus budapestensis TaxID=290110 RepID=A0A2D0IUB2_XENBU|nr:hypothetical protein [Xenorhabdus budapestensis]PHM25459.1 hypothetical protein Xbud_03033 [Xenorhabdus budapestensis]QTL39860.1 hypothetical protein HGO23_19340 [Xenorhabdus budapestensis]